MSLGLLDVDDGEEEREKKRGVVLYLKKTFDTFLSTYRQ